MNNKKIWVLATVSAVGLTYAIIGSNAFADTTVTPVPTVTTPATPTPSVTPTTPVVTPPVAPSVNPSPLSTLPTVGNGQNEGDGQVGDQSDDANQSGENEDGAVTNGDEGDQGVAVQASVDVNQSGDNEGDSNNND
jgi:hypothetical protein